MDNPAQPSPAAAELRRRAEARIRREGAAREPGGLEQIHELQVRQVELEMQLETLAAQNEDLARERAAGAARFGALQRIHAAVSETARAVLEDLEEGALLQRICDIAHQYGDFMLAWIALEDPAARTWRIAARAGSALGYLEGVDISADPGAAAGQGPFGISMRLGRPAVIDDFRTEPRALPWRDRAARSGIVSCASLPIRRDGRAVGALMVYSDRAGFFGPEPLALLERITEGLSYGLDALDRDAERRASEEKLSRMFRLSPDSVSLISLVDGRIKECNDSFTRLLGYSQEEAVGRTTGPGDLDAWALPEDRARFLARLEVEPEITETEVVLRRRAGSVFPAWISASRVEIAGVPYSLAIIRDMTRIREAEADLLRERTFTRALLDNLVEGVAACDERGQLVLLNRTLREWRGMEARQLPQPMRAGHDDLYAADGTTPLAPDRVPMARAFNGEQVQDAGMVIRAPGQPPRHVLASGARILDPEGRRLGAVVVLHDITARRQAETTVQQLNEGLEERIRERTALLEQANAELDAFSYSVSHDLRAPLRGIDGFSLALLEEGGAQLGDAARHYLRRIRSGTQRMGQLIDDLLKLSRVSRSALNRQRLDLSAMARTLLDELRARDPERRVEIRIEPGLAAGGDPGLIHSVLENLLGNAWKYTARAPAARIELFREAQPDGTQAFCVRDNGAGFDMAYVGKLFTAFQRLHALQDFEGSGIGLAIVQRILHRHGGRAWATGAVDQGACFRFTLPEQP